MNHCASGPQPASRNCQSFDRASNHFGHRNWPAGCGFHVHVHEAARGGRIGLAATEDAEAVGDAARSEALDGEADFERIGEGQRPEVAAARFDDEADRGQRADVDAGRLDQPAVHGRVEVRIVSDVVDVAVVVVVYPARCDRAKYRECAADGRCGVVGRLAHATIVAVKTRAAVLDAMGLSPPYATSRPLAIAQVDLDPPGAGEVLVAVRAAGLCHSDLSVIDGNRPRPLPMALGHEAAGVVEALGAGVTDLAVGDHVVTTFVPGCGSCEPCSDGRPALCEPGAAGNAAGTLLGGARRLHRDGADLHHHLGVSAFADRAVVSRRSLVRVDSALPFEEAALFGCAVLTGVGAVVNTAQLRAGSRVAVIGLGGVGLAALLGARAQGAGLTLAIDLSPAKLALARELGATHALDAADPGAEAKARELTRGGVDYAFEMAGSAAALALAYRITRRGGTTVTAGLPHPQASFTVPQVGIVAEERTIKGSYLGGADPARDIPRYIGWYRAGRLPVNRLLSHRLALDDINAGFDRLARGEAVRQVVLFDR